MVSRKIQTYPTRDMMVEAVCDRTIVAMERAMLESGWCMWALSGGSTPRAVLERLAEEPYRSRIVWNRLHLFWGDERTVPPDHSDSNYKMAYDALIRHAPIPEANIHRIDGERDPEEAADEYSREIARLFDSDLPRFDLIWLGMGDDGHTASLFPGTGATDVVDRQATAVYVPRLDTWRVSLTLPVLNAAREVHVLVAGPDKADMMRQVVECDDPTEGLPITMVRPSEGTMYWFVDESAAKKLTRRSFVE